MCFLALAVLAILSTLPLAESHGPESARIGGRDGERMAVVHVVGSALRAEIAKNWREIVPSVRVYGRIYS